MVKGLPRITQVDGICDGCLMAKQARKRFPSQSNYSAAQVLDLVHCDLCGPISPDTAGGNKYFFFLVDDYSRYMWAYLLKSKYETGVRVTRTILEYLYGTCPLKCTRR